MVPDNSPIPATRDANSTTATKPNAHGSLGLCFDDMDVPADWVGPIFQYGRISGKAWFKDGVLTIRREPGYKWHMLSMRRICKIDPRRGLWFHKRFRIEEMLLGADLYVTVRLGNEMILQMGVNGEQHWIQGGKCQPKHFDDELFWGSDVIIGEGSIEDRNSKRTDMRVGLPKNVRLRYTDWALISMYYEVAADSRRIRLFINGREIIYRDIDVVAPAGSIDNRVRPECLHLDKAVPISVELGIFGDGDLYSDTSVNHGAGIRWLHAFAAMTPANPHVSDPRLAESRHSDMHFDYILIHTPDQDAEQVMRVRREVEGTPLDQLLASASQPCD